MKEYKADIIRSDRKTLSVQVTGDGRIIVRVPRRASQASIRAFLDREKEWIEKRLADVAARPKAEKLTMDELRALADKAVQVIPDRVKYYAPLVGVEYGRITIRCQRTRWGSCSAKGNLNFNVLLMLAPPEVLDAVVVHELCHRLELNHSPRFYAEVYRVYPDYDRCCGWLRENGGMLMARVPDA